MLIAEFVIQFNTKSSVLPPNAELIVLFNSTQGGKNKHQFHLLRLNTPLLR